MSSDTFQKYVSRRHRRLYIVDGDTDLVRPQKPSNQSVPNRQSDVPDHHVDRLYYHVLRSNYGLEYNIKFISYEAIIRECRIDITKSE